MEQTVDKITEALTRMFDKHRIIFWYDDKHELRDDFERLNLPDVEKVEINNNEFYLKYRILKESPQQKFLLYHDGPKPPIEDNWLLDILLSHGEFRADQTALWLSELELDMQLTEVVRAHTGFFQASLRRAALKAKLTGEPTPTQLKIKMLAVCTETDERLDAILESLLAEYADGEDNKLNLLESCNLLPFLWEQLQRNYDYTSTSPGIKDFVLTLFNACFQREQGKSTQLNNDALVFLKHWQQSIRNQETFLKLSEEAAHFLKIKAQLEDCDYRNLVNLDIFPDVDRKLLDELVSGVNAQTISDTECLSIIRKRRNTHWFKNHEHVYEAIGYAVQFTRALQEVDLTIETFTEGFKRYTQSWYQLDQLYRKYIYHARKSAQVTLLESLSQKVENHYSNSFLLRLNDNWQQVIDACDRWGMETVPLQRQFYNNHVLPFLSKGKKVFVIISDALRYEIADELKTRLLKEARLDAELSPALSVLPSYTQLGMAALLPHKTLEVNGDDQATVLVDGISSMGSSNRAKILTNSSQGRSTVIGANDLLKQNSDSRKALIKENDVIYVYHNQIDATGVPKTEELLFEAAEQTIDELVKLIKQLTSANASNLLITADHGFLYQYQPLEESDFATSNNEGKQVFYRNRRFVIGKGLNDNSSLKKFDAKALGLEGELEFQFPKSINRLRVKGSSSRFVHGGAALQEIVVPILQINKKRKGEIEQVEVEILNKEASSFITSGQISVSFYQKQPVSEKVHPRRLSAGLYTQQGELISNQVEIVFDMDSENPREREKSERFILTQAANQLNGQEVILRLKENVPETGIENTYTSAKYIMRRSFTSDFDF